MDRRITTSLAALGAFLIVALGIGLTFYFAGGKGTGNRAQAPSHVAQAPAQPSKPAGAGTGPSQTKPGSKPNTTVQPSPSEQPQQGAQQGAQPGAQQGKQPGTAQPSPPSGQQQPAPPQPAKPQPPKPAPAQPKPNTKQPEQPKSNQNQLPEFSSNMPKLYEFGAEWCPPCRQMKPIIDGLKKDYAGQVTVVRIDIDKNQNLVKKYNITAIPVQLFFDADGNQVNRHVGYLAKNDILSQFQKMGVKTNQE